MNTFFRIFSIAALVSVAVVYGQNACDYPPFIGRESNEKSNSWSYVADENTCFLYYFNGRDDKGTVNRFSSLEECEGSCKKSSPCDMKPYSIDIFGKFHNADKIQYWTFDAKINKCDRYEGYKVGNDNRFGSLKECELTCKKRNPCDTQPFAGDESGTVYVELNSPYWAYKANTNECVKHKYGKLSDSEYGFKSLKECESTCKK